MRQQRFEAAQRPLWDELANLIADQQRLPFRRTLAPEALARLPSLYRQVCNHYALARARSYSPTLVASLHDLVNQGHRLLYRQRGDWLARLLDFVTAGFPRTLRHHAAVFWLAVLLFAGPGLIAGGFAYTNPEIIYSLMDEAQVASMEQMYDPAARKLGRTEERSADTDFAMFGFYIWNNVSVGFRTFAGGILFGLGALFYLIFNGLVIGGVAGHLTRLGYTDTFWPFVCGHGAFELTAIAICGAAGLLLGHALLAPGQRRRVDALKEAARPAVTLTLGAAVMLVFAAFIEAFWSSMVLPPPVKYGVAAVLWGLVALYLMFAGRRSERTARAD